VGAVRTTKYNKLHRSMIINRWISDTDTNMSRDKFKLNHRVTVLVALKSYHWRQKQYNTYL